MAVATDLMTVAKLAEAMGVPKSALAKGIKAEKVEPDQVKAGCSYYSRHRIEGMRRKLGV